jgi:hypothetical protein
VIALPPFTGAVQLTVAWPSPAAATTLLGAPGAVGALGVTAFEGLEAGPLPTEFVAVTVNVYAVPFVRPGTTADVASPLTRTTAPPGDAVTQ